MISLKIKEEKFKLQKEHTEMLLLNFIQKLQKVKKKIIKIIKKIKVQENSITIYFPFITDKKEKQIIRTEK
jgi:hypothetical protein